MNQKQAAAIAIVLSHDSNQLLLVKRRDAPIWVLPGGGIDEGEAPGAAAAREVLEETGVQVTSQRLVGRYLPINRLGRLTYVFVCTPIAGVPIPTEESLYAAYFLLSDLPSPLFFIHRGWIEDALANHPLPLEKRLEEVTYWNFFKYLISHPWIVGRYLLSRLGLPWNSR